MSSTRTLPPLLQPYLSLPPESSLILLTSVLGASTNWLLLRHLHSYLSSDPSAAPTKILFISFLRDWAFWREGGRKIGCDLDRGVEDGRVIFSDCLGASLGKGGGLDVGALRTEWKRALEKLKGGDANGKVMIVVDQIDFLLAASAEQGIGGKVEDLIVEFREVVHATVLTVAADEPLVVSQQTPLECRHAALLLGLAHQADVVMGLRLLDTGTARDVSGVLRITNGGARDQEVEERECLYFVAGDGGVKVFERGQ